MLRINFEKNDEGEMQVKLLPESQEEKRKINEILRCIEIENPVITYGKIKDREKTISPDIDSMEHYCGVNGWCNNDKTYSKLNALVLVQNLMNRMIQKKTIVFRPCFDFDNSDDTLEFSLYYCSIYDIRMLKDCYVDFNMLFSGGRDLNEFEQNFVNMIQREQTYMNVYELIQKLVELLWKYYST